MADRKVTIDFEPSCENVDIARAAILGICHQRFPAPELEHLSMDFALATTEAMVNAVEHSETKKVVVALTVTATAVIFEMITDGVTFNPTTPVPFPDITSPDKTPEGGFGLAIMKGLVDRMTYRYENGTNVLTLEKIFCRSGKAPGMKYPTVREDDNDEIDMGKAREVK